MKIWSRSETHEYLGGLPIGTGRIAAMILGDPDNERCDELAQACSRGEQPTLEHDG